MIGRGRDLSEARECMELEVKARDRVRLDTYLRENLVWKSRRRIQELIRDGNITVNGRPAKPSQGVRGGDRVEVRLSMGTGVPADYSEYRVRTIYEDPWLVAIDKPPGMLVHPVGRHVYDTLMNYLHYRYLRAEEGKNTPPRLCHRIDKDTTGLVLVAKDTYVHQRVQRQFETRQVEKEYLALAAGRIPPETAEIDLPIGEGTGLEEALRPPLRPARTRIAVLEALSGPGGEACTLVAARPVTGRQNQIRVHLAAAGHPLVADVRYGGSSPAGFPGRFLLHARKLRFWHPRLGSAVELEAEPPADFGALLAELRHGAPLPGAPEPRAAP